MSGGGRKKGRKKARLERRRGFLLKHTSKVEEGSLARKSRLCSNLSSVSNVLVGEEDGLLLPSTLLFTAPASTPPHANIMVRGTVAALIWAGMTITLWSCEVPQTLHLRERTGLGTGEEINTMKMVEGKRSCKQGSWWDTVKRHCPDTVALHALHHHRVPLTLSSSKKERKKKKEGRG